MQLSSLSNHHAILLIHPSRKSITETLWKELSSESIAHVLYDHTVIDIDTARKIIIWANTPYHEKKTALVTFHTITVPAQNALLKIIEEPKANVRFILITTNKEAIIPTLYSRLQEHTLQENTLPNDHSDAKRFLSTSHGERMKLPYIQTLLTQEDEEGRKDREAIKTFILSLVTVLGDNKDYQRYTLLTLEMASYAGDPSASGKALLEYLALVLPQVR